ncbi:MAG: serine/threonine-protein kinase [Spirochaetales bacterium]
MKESDRIGDYTLVRQIGRGISASTWLAHPANAAEGKSDAVLKILDLSEASTWNMVDIFKRESEALRTLSHPGIPAYLDSFESEAEGRLRLVLAMELIEGQDLEKIVKSGKKFAETEVERILAELSGILTYLGSLRPPIVHRDVNPRNIIMRPDGSIVLVDFSGVQDAVRTALFPGATLVGTAGYIPLEQVGGKATHRSDLYGAAATAVFLLTGRNPAELPTSGLKIDLSGIVDLSDKLSAVLGSWLEPDVARRSLSASDAAAILRGEAECGVAAPAPAPPPDSADQQYAGARRRAAAPSAKRRNYPESLPAESKILIERMDDGVKVTLPRAGMKGSAAPGAMFATIWIGFVAFWTLMTLRMRAPFFFPAFSIPFWGVGFFMVKTMLGPAFSKREIILTRENLIVKTNTFGLERASAWPLRDIGSIRLVPSRLQVNSLPSKELLVEAGTRHVLIGAGLSERELQYLEIYLDEELGRLREP